MVMPQSKVNDVIFCSFITVFSLITLSPYILNYVKKVKYFDKRIYVYLLTITTIN